jgi:hypothetical protein
MSVEPPESLDFENLDQYSEEEIEAYNEQKEQEIAERIADLREQEQAAVEALRSDAQDSIETATVELPSGLELDIRTRFTQRAERLQEELADLEQQDASVADIRWTNAELLAEMCETKGYDQPAPWDIAARDDDAGLVWMMEVTDAVIEPIADKAEAMQGNRQGSASSRGQTADRQSGGFRRR